MPSELLMDESFRAAQINQRHGYGFICAASYGRCGRVVIVEKIRTPYQGWTFRVKTIHQRSFPTLEEAVEYCRARNVNFPLITDDPKNDFYQVRSGQGGEGRKQIPPDGKR